MLEAALQIMLTFAYLAIGLVAVTFPVFAICVIYLKQEKWETEKERKRQIDSVQRMISELNEKLRVEREPSKLKEINKKIRQFMKERSSLEEGLVSITAKGAVGAPIFMLTLALFFAAIGIYSCQTETTLNVLVAGIGSASMIGLALVSLYKTIERIEEAALRPARTIEVDVCYKSLTKSCEIKLGIDEMVEIGAKPEADLEYCSFAIFLPPEIEHRGSEPEYIETLQPPGSRLAGYTQVRYEQPFLRHGSYCGTSFLLKGKKEGDYTIPVEIQAKDVKDYRSELTLKVKKQ